MMIKLETFGEMEIVRPPLSTCFDLVSMWSDEQNRSQLGRLCAMAVCVCGNNPKLPKTRHLIDLHQYGSRCLDVLLGADVTIDQILESGLQCLSLMAEALPSAKEVKETENFIEPPNPET